MLFSFNNPAISISSFFMKFCKRLTKIFKKKNEKSVTSAGKLMEISDIKLYRTLIACVFYFFIWDIEIGFQ
jgi:hypothetical protein